MKAAVLGIGTELTDGQIVNKNASWISSKLKEIGITTSIHLVVPDERHLMQQGIEFCAAKADVIFLTGGLGPTSDDFTRDIVAEWAKRKLLFDEASWRHVSERLTSRGYSVKDIQKQQCYFPEGAEILSNSEGTANGFGLTIENKMIFVLPGPPREIEAIWNSHISFWLHTNTLQLDPYITRKWDTIGVGESDIAVIVEEILNGHAADVGYRVHLPYVEVKLSFFKSQESKNQKLIENLTKSLEFCTVSRDGEDVAKLLAKKIKHFPSITVRDELSGQFLTNRLMPSLRAYMSTNQWTFTNLEIQQSSCSLDLWLKGFDGECCEIGLRTTKISIKETINSPYITANMLERRQQYFAEMAIIHWLKNLE